MNIETQLPTVALLRRSPSNEAWLCQERNMAVFLDGMESRLRLSKPQLANQQS